LDLDYATYDAKKRAILWITVRGIWYYRLADEKTFHSTGRRDRATAEAEIIAHPGKRLRDPRAGRLLTLNEFAADFFVLGMCKWIAKQHALGHSFEQWTAAARPSYLTKHILPKFGSWLLTKITKHAVMEWLVELELSNQTRNHLLYTLRIIMREAKDANLIHEDPLLAVERFGDSYQARDAFTAAELRALFPPGKAELRKIWGKPPTSALFMLMAGAGLRSGEARALRWRHVLWGEKALLLEDTCKGQGKHLVIGPIAEKKGGARIELLPSRCVEELADWRKEALFEDPDDLIFPGDDRQIPLCRNTVGRRLSVAIQRVNAMSRKKKQPEPISIGEKILVVHSMRHTYVTRMRRLAPRGIPLAGHHSETITDRYDHPNLVEQIRDREAMRPALEAIWE
jgi:integrase